MFWDATVVGGNQKVEEAESTLINLETMAAAGQMRQMNAAVAAIAEGTNILPTINILDFASVKQMLEEEVWKVTPLFHRTNVYETRRSKPQCSRSL